MRIRKGIPDETPIACNDIDTGVANQSDLVEVEQCLEQMVCVKG